MPRARIRGSGSRFFGGQRFLNNPVHAIKIFVLSIGPVIMRIHQSRRMWLLEVTIIGQKIHRRIKSINTAARLLQVIAASW